MSSQAISRSALSRISQGLCHRGIPKHETAAANRQWMLERMTLAFRAFARKGFAFGIAGHISMRDPVHTERFWLNPLGKHFGLLSVSDMAQIDHAGDLVGGNRAPVNAAGFQIHSAIYKARPDVKVICHSHSPYGVAWSQFARPLEMLTQDAAYLYNAQAVYKDFEGVVLDDAEGQHIVDAMGEDSKGLILANHGLLTVGGTVEEAYFLHVLMERCCQFQLAAEAAAANGAAKQFLTDESAASTAESSSTPETLYLEGLPDLDYEEAMCEGRHRA